MYCPKCGQQQISDEMRFCSRCGLLMSGLAEWIAGGGGSAASQQDTLVSANSARRQGIRRGAKVMFLSGVLFPVFLGLSLLVNEGALMIIPIIFLFVGLIMMLYARLFSEAIAPLRSRQAQTYGLGSTGAGALPSESNTRLHGPANFAGHRVRTNELAQPPSVTEHTTKLLDKE